MKKFVGTLTVLGVLSCAGTAVAGPIAVGGAAFKDHPTVTDTPKYTMGLPAYFTPGNIVGQLTNAPINGQLSGLVTTTVYRNPANGFLTFQYEFTSTNSLSPAVRATLGGQWMLFNVTDAGADSSGVSGGNDPGAEWTDGDPLFLARSPTDGAPSVQFRAFGLGAGLFNGDFSSNIWFQTNATDFAQAPMAWLDTAITGQGIILAPAVIPLPPAAGLGVLGLGLLAVARRRFR
ncbi:MAG TPA: hypothetical protein VD963_03115 [Phycisphaerales bacterium]|nr:hypothetical protein [Phycisphaerales bacterium]